MNKREIRAFESDIIAKDSYNEKTLSGQPIVYNEIAHLDGFDEMIEVGALDNADLKDVKFLVNHDKNMIPLARSRNNNENSTMHLQPNAEGLHVNIKLDVQHNKDAEALYSAVARGDVSGMSFMFTVRKDEWKDLESDTPLRVIKEIDKVFEVSAVTFPAYDATNINTRSALESARRALENAQNELNQEKLLIEKEFVHGIFNR